MLLYLFIVSSLVSPRFGFLFGCDRCRMHLTQRESRFNLLFGCFLEVTNQICLQMLAFFTGKCVLILIAQNERSMKNDQQNIYNSPSIHPNSAFRCAHFLSAWHDTHTHTHSFLFSLLLSFSSLHICTLFSLLPLHSDGPMIHISFFLFVLMPAQKWVQFWLSIIDHWNLFFCRKKCSCQNLYEQYEKKNKTEFLSKCESECAFNWLRLKLVMFYCCSLYALAFIGYIRLCIFGYGNNWKIESESQQMICSFMQMCGWNLIDWINTHTHYYSKCLVVYEWKSKKKMMSVIVH